MPPKVKFVSPLNVGMYFDDDKHISWKIGKVIGHGGFSIVYKGTRESMFPAAQKLPAEVAIKVQPDGDVSQNESGFYRTYGYPDNVSEFEKRHKLEPGELGIPALIGETILTIEKDGVSTKFSVLIFKLYATDYEQVAISCNLRQFYGFASSTIKTLHFLASHELAHADIKLENFCPAKTPDGKNISVLIDFGLVLNNDSSTAKGFNGTMSFMSTTAHDGIFGSRIDLEALCYSLVRFLTGTLTWFKFCPGQPDHNDESLVAAKREVWIDTDDWLMKAFGKCAIPEPLRELFRMVSACKPDGFEFDYEAAKQLFEAATDKLEEGEGNEANVCKLIDFDFVRKTGEEGEEKSGKCVIA